MYGHDLMNSHFQTGKGAITTPVVKWSYTTGNAVEVHGPCLANIIGDEKLEVIFGSFDHKVYCLNYDGSLLWSYTTGNYVYSSPAVADIDNDGNLEVIVGSYDNKVYCLNHDGLLFWSFDAGGDVHRGISVANIDRTDDELEILIPNNDLSTLYCLNHDGSVLWSITLAGDVHDISIGDIDCDSCLELAVGTYGQYKLWVIDDLGNTHGCDNPSGITEDRSQKTEVRIQNFNDRLMFYLPYSGSVSLRVYDICGREVREPINSYFAAGSHTIRLSGIGSGDPILPSGIYFAHLVYNDRKYNIKLLIIK